MTKKSDAIRFGRQITPDTCIATRRDAESERDVIVRQQKDGAPMLPRSEVAVVSPKCSDGWHELRTLYRSGPAQVATPAYRDGYDRVFGKKPNVGLA